MSTTDVEAEAIRLQARIKECSRLIRGRALTKPEKDALRQERDELRGQLQDLDIYDPEQQRLPRGYLAHDVWIVCRDFVAGEFVLDEGSWMTPYTIAKIMRDNALVNLDEDEIKEMNYKMPSSGAITAVFKRWEDNGYARFRSNPFAFLEFTEEADNLNPSEFLERKKAKNDDA